MRCANGASRTPASATPFPLTRCRGSSPKGRAYGTSRYPQGTSVGRAVSHKPRFLRRRVRCWGDHWSPAGGQCPPLRCSHNLPATFSPPLVRGSQERRVETVAPYKFLFPPKNQHRRGGVSPPAGSPFGRAPAAAGERGMKDDQWSPLRCSRKVAITYSLLLITYYFERSPLLCPKRWR